MDLLKEFTSTGSKLAWHPEVLDAMRKGQGKPIVAHVMPTDVCNFTCAFCSVQHRAGDTLTFPVVEKFLHDLYELGLKAVIFSGGGNPLLYRCSETDARFADLIDLAITVGLQIGVITNGMPLKEYTVSPKWPLEDQEPAKRWSYPTLPPAQLDRLAWIRVSLAGWDHGHDECWTPDVDSASTVLGGSYVAHDIYIEPSDEKHGKVSLPEEQVTPGQEVRRFEDRMPELERQLADWIIRNNPRYIRLLPNCLEPALIPMRCEQLELMAARINELTAAKLQPERGNVNARNPVFVQQKPPRQPQACYKGYVHPVLNCDGWVYPCDSVVLNRDAGHAFSSKWRICRAETVKTFFKMKMEPNVPNDICPGCVFPDQCDEIAGVKEKGFMPVTDGAMPKHVNFI